MRYDLPVVWQPDPANAALLVEPQTYLHPARRDLAGIHARITDVGDYQLAVLLEHPNRFAQHPRARDVDTNALMRDRGFPSTN